MRTPAGKECRYFYGDYFRGRKREECRLLASANPPLPWKGTFCASCPVPEILMANACEHMVLQPRLTRTLPFGFQQVRILTQCKKTNRSGFEAQIGCGECHPLPDIFTRGSLDKNSTD